MTRGSLTDRWRDALKLKIETIKLKYNIRREYFTVGIPVVVALMLLMFAVMTGHTLFEDKNSKSAEKSDREKAYEDLIKQMNEEGGEGSSAINTSAEISEEIPLPAASKVDLDHYLIYAAIVAMTPYSIDRFFQRREKKKNEEDFSQFLFKLSELMRAGIDPIKSVVELSKTDLGSIKKHVTLAASSLMLGNSFEESMKKTSASLKSELISKYIDLVVQASYTGGAVSNLILKASEDMRSMIMIEREMQGNLQQYVMIFYFAQLILIVMVYILSTQLFPFLTDSGMKALFGGSGIGDLNFKQGFFHLLIINALIGGIIIGKITEGSAKDGLKHSVILTVVSYLACVLIIIPAATGDTITIKVVSGDGQKGYVSMPLENQIMFQVLGSSGKPVENAVLDVSISPSGEVLDNLRSTDETGNVSIRVALGDTPGTYQIVAKSGDASATAIATAEQDE